MVCSSDNQALSDSPSWNYTDQRQGMQKDADTWKSTTTSSAGTFYL